MPACAFIYSVTDSRLSYVQQSTLYCIYVMFMQTMLSRVLFGVLRTSHVLNSANTGAVLGFLSGAFKSSHWHIRTPPDLHPRHVCPPCRSPAHRSIFSRSFPALISHFIPCPRPYIFFLFCGQPCFLLRICATLRRRYQCVLILPMGTLPLFFSLTRLRVLAHSRRCRVCEDCRGVGVREGSCCRGRTRVCQGVQELWYLDGMSSLFFRVKKCGC